MAIDPYRRKGAPGTGFTSRDVARLAGVSQSTVSYVLTGKRPISEATRKRVRDAIDQLTYHPNASARALASQRTRVIALMAPLGEGADGYELLPFIEAVTARARARDHDVLLVTSAEGHAGLTRVAGRGMCDGILLLDVGARDPRVTTAAGLKVPVVLIGLPAEACSVPSVDLDYDRGAELAIRHLVAGGHDQVLVIGHPASIVDRGLHFVNLIERGAVRAASQGGIPLQIVSPVEYGRAAAEAAVARILELRRPGARLGILLCKPRGAQFLLDALTARGLTPGDEISVIGLCADDAAAEMSPPLTNISVQSTEVAELATDLLFRLLDNPGDGEPGSVHLISPTLTVRATSPVPRP